MGMGAMTLTKASGIFILKNLIRMWLLLAAVSIAAFVLASASPLDPLQTNVGQAAMGAMSQEQIKKLETYWGTDEEPVQRYLHWAKDALHGDMGESLLYRRPVLEVIGQRLSNSLFVLLFAWVTAGILGVVLGMLAGIYRGSWLDKAVRGYALLMASTPVFWLALLLLLIFAVWLKVLPIGFGVPIGVEAADVTLQERITHAILPALTLSITGISNITLHTREKMVEIMESEYMLFALARGEKKRERIFRHGVRNMVLPALTLQFASVGEIIGGSVLAEQVFSYPGLGQAAVTAGIGGDVPLLLGITVVTAAMVFLGNFVADLLYGIVDPRIRERGMRP